MKNETLLSPPTHKNKAKTFCELSGMPLQNERIEFKLARHGLRSVGISICSTVDLDLPVRGLALAGALSWQELCPVDVMC